MGAGQRTISRLRGSDTGTLGHRPGMGQCSLALGV